MPSTDPARPARARLGHVAGQAATSVETAASTEAAKVMAVPTEAPRLVAQLEQVAKPFWAAPGKGTTELLVVAVSALAIGVAAATGTIDGSTAVNDLRDLAILYVGGRSGVKAAAALKSKGQA